MESDPSLCISERRKKVDLKFFLFSLRMSVILGCFNHSCKCEEDLCTSQSAVYLSNTSVAWPMCLGLDTGYKQTVVSLETVQCDFSLRSARVMLGAISVWLAQKQTQVPFYDASVHSVTHNSWLCKLWIIKLWIIFDVLLWSIFLQAFLLFPCYIHLDISLWMIMFLW